MSRLVKFLIIRFSSIGDIVLTTPAVRCLKKQVEDAEIHFVTKKDFLPLLKNNPHIEKIHVIEDSLYALAQKLKVEEYDYIIDLHRNLRSLIIKSRLRIISFTLSKINFLKFLMIRFKINRLPDKHIVDRYLETLKVFDVKNDGKGLDYFIPEEDEVSLSDLPEFFREGYISVVCGAQHGTKQMPPEKIADICRELNLPVILLGGPRESVLGKQIDKQTGDNVLNACGKYNINQSASLIR
ncbi:glycosyltransferase family 9 protein, partial [Bacteroidota bacterium]